MAAYHPDDSGLISTAVAGAVIHMRNTRFDPYHVVVPRGCPLKFVNHDNADHNVVVEIDLGSVTIPIVMFPEMGLGQSNWFLADFSVGTYDYHCHPHHDVMKGKLTIV